MKRISFVLAIFVCSVCAVFAQNKILEASAKKAPSWLGSANQGMIVVTGYGADLAAAQENALVDLKNQMVLAIASNIEVDQTSEALSVTQNGMNNTTDIYHEKTRIKGANLPFLKGITLSKAEETYWVKQQENGRIVYVYHVLYPFSDAQLNALILEYETLEKEKVAELKRIHDQIGEIENVKDIKAGIAQLMALKEFFPDRVRQAEVDAVIQEYKSLYSYLSVATSFTAPGECVAQLLLNGNPVATGAAPKVKSECASQINIRQQDGVFIITYNDEDCLDDEDNFLDISFLADGKKVAAKAYLPKKSDAKGAQKFSVIPEGKVYLQAADSDGSTLTDISIRISVNNRGGVPFGLKSIELNVPELQAPIVFDDINGVYRSKGVVQIKAVAEGLFKVREVKTSSAGFVKGKLTVVNPETQATEAIAINLTYSTNW
ncbi:MAG: plethodontid receptivity factor PRF [Bacteroidales bacterium]|nr:plethodontid receptivity factor PRF [Candidatus Liminaster caballi]